jgi:hypothetical protein
MNQKHRMSAWIVAALISVAATDIGVAQGSAVANNATDPVIQYSRNESGGRISLTFPGADSTALESHRLGLLELAAAIRRGDFRSVWVLSPDSPGLQVLAERRSRLRCTLRPTARGAELVLLSDDDAVVAAIHQVLSNSPPRSVRL